MRIATILSLGASAALGLGALFVARVWLPAQTATAKPAPVSIGVPVVVAATAIAYGAKVDARQLTVVRLPAEAAPPGAFGSVDQVMKQDGGAPVALAAISVREPVLAIKLSGPGMRPTLAAMIGEGMRAYTVGVTEVGGGGGHVLPGDRVDVMVTRDVSTQPGMDGAKGKLTTDVVIQNVRVLGMDLNVDPNSTHAAIAHTATLEVRVDDAERLALAGQAGTLSLALRRTGAAEIASVRPMLASDLANGGGAHAQPGPARVVVRRAASARRPAVQGVSGASVIVVHGESSSSVSVPAERFGAGV